MCAFSASLKSKDRLFSKSIKAKTSHLLTYTIFQSLYLALRVLIVSILRYKEDIQSDQEVILVTSPLSIVTFTILLAFQYNTFYGFDEIWAFGEIHLASQSHSLNCNVRSETIPATMKSPQCLVEVGWLRSLTQNYDPKPRTSEENVDRRRKSYVVTFVIHICTEQL